MARAGQGLTPANIVKVRADKEKAESIKDEHDKTVQDVVDRIASTPDGILFFREMRARCGVDVESRTFEPMLLAGEKALRGLYLSFWIKMSIGNKRRLLG